MRRGWNKVDVHPTSLSPCLPFSLSPCLLVSSACRPLVAKDGGRPVGVGHGVERDVADELVADHRHRHALEAQAGQGPLLRHAVGQAGLVVALHRSTAGWFVSVRPADRAARTCNGPVTGATYRSPCPVCPAAAGCRRIPGWRRPAPSSTTWPRRRPPGRPLRRTDVHSIEFEAHGSSSSETGWVNGRIISQRTGCENRTGIPPPAPIPSVRSPREQGSLLAPKQ